MQVTPKRFIHLNVHSNYSIGVGAIYTKDMIEFCIRTQSPAIAITDISNLYGALEFSKELSNAGIQPIIGVRLTIAEKQSQSIKTNQHHHATEDTITLLVQSQEGYKNILALLSLAYLEDATRINPFITMEELKNHAGGLIILSNGVEGPLGNALKNNKKDEALSLAKTFKAIFNERFYMEIARHNDQDEERYEEDFLNIAYKENIPLVATNNPTFVNQDMYEAHDVYLCIAAGATINDGSRKRLTPQHYLKTPEEMIECFKDLPEAILNTEIIAKKCRFFCEWQEAQLPSYSSDEKELLKQRATEGLTERLKKVKDENKEDIYNKRLAYELDVIIQMHFEGYFLIVSDFISWAKDNNIPVGPGRGSGAGSLVAWALRITEVNPIRFGLLFERFLNPDRISMPDFDIDFCQTRRDEVISYVQQKYGYDRVANIITFGKLQARAVVRDVGRVLEIPYGQINEIAKNIPFNPANPITLEQAIQETDTLKNLIKESSTMQRLFTIAKQLEGLYRHVSTHAAGVVIGAKPLKEIVPLYRDPSAHMPVTGFNMKYVESAGLVKFDFLGLKTLTVIAKALDIIKKTEAIDVDIENIPLNDANVFEFLATGKTVGIFQMESIGMRNVLIQMKPDSIEDIIAIISLYRPGPMENIPTYINRKHKKEENKGLHPLVDSVLNETFGIMVYQEQVMEIAKRMGNYTLGAADLLRRSMGKKDKKEMKNHRKTFIQGAMTHGVSKEKADSIFTVMEKFAGYGFNKSHAAAYAIIAYQTAYLKKYHPEAFLAAAMTLDSDDVDKIGTFITEAKNLGIEVRPPDINQSEKEFSIEKKAIRYALSAIKGMGEHMADAIVQERQTEGNYTSIQNVAERLSMKDLNKRYLESMIKAGVFDSLEPNRAKLFENSDAILAFSHRIGKDREVNQIGLFADGDNKNQQINTIVLKDSNPWTVQELASHEHQSLGFYLTKHPLDTFTPLINWLNINISDREDKDNMQMLGYLQNKKLNKTQHGKYFTNYVFSDNLGTFEITIFQDQEKEFTIQPEVGGIYHIQATPITTKTGENKKKIIAITPLEQVKARIAITISITEGMLPNLEVILNEQKTKGNDDITLHIQLKNHKRALFNIPNKRVNGRLINALCAMGAEVKENH